MAFSAQGGMFPQQLQALVNVNPGAQLTLQQTGNLQMIGHTQFSWNKHFVCNS
jgi:hypothetical protein